ncbi:MAG: hypothetical protein HY884_01125 [Deltaproteobacteria bacterium]|nr:hypothetical protein [Deltaproteobacteria bacterium]
MRKFLSVIAVLLMVSALFLPSPVRAATADKGITPPAEEEKAFEGRAQTMAVTNGFFIKSAKRFGLKLKSPDASGYLKKAEEASDKAGVHMKAREFTSAVEDFSASTHYAIQAIVIYKNAQTSAIRDAALREQADVKAGRDKKTKAGLTLKRLTEVETFVQAATRLLKEREEPFVMEKLKAVQELYNSAKTSLSAGLDDLALENATKAYKLATDTVIEIKTARAEIITFPKPRTGDDTAAYNYEWRRNDTYSFFASQIISDPDKETKKLLRSADEKKDEAMNAGKDGDLKKGVEAFKTSTEFFMEAIKGSVK